MTSFAGIHGLGNAQPSHPLAAVRRMGVVTDTSNIPGSITVLVGGDTTNPVDIPFLQSYSPSVGDNVVLLAVGPDYVAIGSISQGLTASNYFEERKISTISAISSTSASGFSYGNQVDLEGEYPSAYNAASGVWTCPVFGLYLFHFEIAPNNLVAAGRNIFFLNLNGSNVMRDEQDTNASGGVAFSAYYGPTKMNAGDTLSTQAQFATSFPPNGIINNRASFWRLP